MRRSSSVKRSLATSLAKYGLNPLNRGLMRPGIRPPGTALLETTGGKSGKTRRNPVTDGLDDETTFWIVAEHGRHAGYVRNIEANPRVRVMVAGRWRTGIAHLLDDDDPRHA
jgi:deazaflavin-dependent oxidoreductase (nitroreductase family)